MRWVQLLIFFTIKKILQEYEYNRLLSACQNLHETMGDIDPLEITDELNDLWSSQEKTKIF